MAPTCSDMHWYAYKVFYGKGKPVKEYCEDNELDCFYDIEKKVRHKDGRECTEEVAVVPNLIFVRCTRQEAEHTERMFLNKIMLYRHRDSNEARVPSEISDREIDIFKIVATSGVEGLDFYDQYNPKYEKGDKVRVISGPFKGAEGYIVRIKGNHRLYVSIKGFCAVAAGYIPKAFLEKIN